MQALAICAPSPETLLVLPTIALALLVPVALDLFLFEAVVMSAPAISGMKLPRSAWARGLSGDAYPATSADSLGGLQIR